MMYIICMIKVSTEGVYKLIETKGQTKVLQLDGRKKFAWIHSNNIGEILVASQKEHKTDHILAIGKYRIYDVKDEADFTDLIHLELFVGGGKWQGYLLPTGLPKGEDIRNRIIPTDEIITRSTT